MCRYALLKITSRKPFWKEWTQLFKFLVSLTNGEKDPFNRPSTLIYFFILNRMWTMLIRCGKSKTFLKHIFLIFRTWKWRYKTLYIGFVLINFYWPWFRSIFPIPSLSSFSYNKTEYYTGFYWPWKDLASMLL